MSAAVRSRSGTYEAELAREVTEFCRRVLGDGEAARQAAAVALDGDPERVTALGRAARACRQRAASDRIAAGDGPRPDGLSLSEAVAWELAVANQALPDRLREAITLRELLRLSYAQIGLAMGIDAGAVAALLARARLALRAELRGEPLSTLGESCPDRGRALRVLARRHDSEPLGIEDDAWIHTHLRHCAECTRAHAAMLEASVRYRAWRRPTR